ncbi:hypothetical protein [Novosphingobium sp. CECT 9465]|uniref:hypothetical protein n=1 Tax=Novosphingobium sp. CECT 9465 TaxID=2829794 RepID=UPI001E48EE4C|nr:hypothetical protein [Novosphingobium sp. CECT 9465]
MASNRVAGASRATRDDFEKAAVNAATKALNWASVTSSRGGMTSSVRQVRCPPDDQFGKCAGTAH